MSDSPPPEWDEEPYDDYEEEPDYMMDVPAEFDEPPEPPKKPAASSDSLDMNDVDDAPPIGTIAVPESVQAAAMTLAAPSTRSTMSSYDTNYTLESFNNAYRQTKSSSPTKKRALSRPTTAKPQSASDASILFTTNTNRLDPLLSVSHDLPALPTAHTDSVPCTLLNGNIVYISRKSPAPSVPTTTTTSTTSSGNLLSLPMTTLNARSDSISRAQTLVKNSQEKQPNHPSHANTAESSLASGQLWVDKYAPKNFADLLSDERTNREVLRAIRAWDPFVFKSEAPIRPILPDYMGQTGQFKQATPFNKSSDGDNMASSSTKDIRPLAHERVILLAGPPGSGKTTLAHSLAALAGYRSIEINASDERSTAVLVDRVTSAMEQNTLSFSKGASKPNLVILDECDGADGKATISALVNIIKAPCTTPTHLLRPLIFICNNRYAPALAPLLSVATVFNLSPVASPKLLTRLKHICNAEKLIAPPATLSKLVQSCNNDVRSSLHTLQYISIKERLHSTSKTVDVSGALEANFSRGGKDDKGDLRTVMRMCFHRGKEGKVVAGIGVKKRKGEGIGKEMRDCAKVFDAIDALGESSKVLDCLFSNMVKVGFMDIDMTRSMLAHEYLSSADCLRGSNPNVNSDGYMYYLANNYTPTAAGAVRVLCCVDGAPPLTVNAKEGWEVQFKREEKMGLLQQFVNGLSLETRCSTTEAVQSLVPTALSLLSAGANQYNLSRTVTSTSLYSPTELSAFEYRVDVLRGLGLSYVEEPNPISAFVNDAVELTPTIGKLVEFDNLEKAGVHESESEGTMRRSIPAVVKELLAFEAKVKTITAREDRDKEKVVAAMPAKRAGASPSPKKVKEAAPKTPIAAPKVVSPTPPPVSFLAQKAAKAKSAKKARRAQAVGITRDKTVKVKSHTGSGVEISEVVKFKHQKGFTQAVKIKSKMSDFVLG